MGLIGSRWDIPVHRICIISASGITAWITHIWPLILRKIEVKEAMDAVRTLKMRGCNVTMPCKNEALKYMDELSPAARIVGAVNTIVNDNGRLTGHMTDGIGFVHNLKAHGVEVKGKHMVILGAGGAATAIQVQCALDGAASLRFSIRTTPSLTGPGDSGKACKGNSGMPSGGILSGG